MPNVVSNLRRAGSLALLLMLGWAPTAAAAEAAVPGAALTQARTAPLPAIELKSAQGPSSTASWRGQWTWLYLGFVSCPDACPTALNDLARERRQLKAPEDVAVRFVSVDPARDTPQKLADYVRYFDPSFSGLTGSHAAIDRLVAAVGARYQLFPPEKPGGYYAVGHPNQVFVLDPEGRLAAVYDLRAPNGKLAADFNALAARAANAGLPEAPAKTPLKTPGAAAAPSDAGETLASALDGRSPVPSGLPPAAAPLVSTLGGDTAGAWCGPVPGLSLDESTALMRRARTLGSGTSVLPMESPMRMSTTGGLGWVWMLHGDLATGATQGSSLSPLALTPSWLMVNGARAAGPGVVDVRAMGALDKLRYRQNGQLAGSSHHGVAAAPAPGDTERLTGYAMELSGRYTWNLDPRTALFAYAAPIGEPALGPGLFQHRPSAADNHRVPLGLAITDGSHALAGVATVGGRRDDHQVEFSQFNARPGVFAALDSWSGRWTYFPGSQWALQLSGGALKDAEPNFPGVRPRASASATHSVDTPWGRLSTTASAAQEVATALPRLGLLLESQLDAPFGGHVYGRLEQADRFTVTKSLVPLRGLTLGYTHDLGPQALLSGALGADASVVTVAGVPETSLYLYARLRPPGF